jgi:hypothetical protein
MSRSTTQRVDQLAAEVAELRALVERLLAGDDADYRDCVVRYFSLRLRDRHFYRRLRRHQRDSRCFHARLHRQGSFDEIR